MPDHDRMMALNARLRGDGGFERQTIKMVALNSQTEKR